MNSCIYCSSPTQGKVCMTKLCQNKRKQQHRCNNLEHYRDLQKQERKRNYSNRKINALAQAKTRYYSSNLKYVAALMFQNSRARAKQFKMDFDLDEEFLNNLLMEQDQKCALTKLEFKYEPEDVTTTYKRPFAPSLDRIDSTKGYTKDNVRFVCIIVNFALSEFGDNAFDKMCKAYMRNNVKQGN